MSRHMGNSPAKNKNSFFQGVSGFDDSSAAILPDIKEPFFPNQNIFNISVVPDQTKPPQEVPQIVDKNSTWNALESLKACLWRLDPKSGMVDISPEGKAAFERVFNVDHQCLTEGRYGFSIHIHPDDRDRVLAMLAQRIDHTFQLFFRIVDREQKERWISLQVGVLRKESANRQVVTDSIWLFAQNNTHQKAEEEKQKRILANRILSSLFGSDLKSLPRDEFSSQNLMEKITQKWRALIEEKNIRWIGPDSAPMGPASVMEGSEELLTLLTDSLFENALEAALSNPHPGVQPWVRFDFFEDKESIFIAISDSGPGIPIIYRGQIFEPFFSTRPEHTPGLGLSLGRSAAEWHNGSLRLDHYSDHTRFIAQIPKHPTLATR